MGDVYDIQTGQRVPMTVEQYNGIIDTMLKYFAEARKTRRDAYRQTEEILIEVRFAASYSLPFREATRDDMRDILDIIYEDVNAE